MHKTSHEEFEKILSSARKKIEVGALYYHYKNPDKLYRIVGLSVWEETEELAVNYQSVYGKGITFTRLLKVFLEKVDGPGGKKTTRFTNAK